jgi:hypothetical protein
MGTPLDFTPDQLMTPEAMADPYPVYRRLRDHTPLRYIHFPAGVAPGVDELLWAWALMKYADV